MRNFNFYLPVLDDMGVEEDSVRFSDASESFFNWLEALNRPLLQFSVLTLFSKIAKCVLGMRRSFQVVGIRFAF